MALRSVGGPPSPDDVRVWYRATGGLSAEAVSDLERTLSDDEVARSARFQFFQDRRDFAAAHALVRRTLSLYGVLPPRAWRFQSNSYGKPRLASDDPSGLTFNLSHTRGLVACAVARGADVGIDVEPIDLSKSRRDIAVRFFSVLEHRSLDACPPDEYPRRFVQLWTLKEAFIKAVGTGLSCGLDTFSFGLCADGGIHFNPPPGESSDAWQFALTSPVPGFCLAVAMGRAPGDRRYCIALHDADRESGTPIAWMLRSSGLTAGVAE